MPRFIKPFIISAVAFGLPLITSAAFRFEIFGPDYIFDTALLFINRFVVILVGIATIVFFWGVIQYVISQGDETKLKAGRKYMVWGIIGLVVIAATWGIVNLIIFTIFGETTFSLPGFVDFGGGGSRKAIENCPICLRCQDSTATPAQCLACDICLGKESF